ncbi:MAG: 16S rRNA (uracil(1498)-N(3))-methyltransferase [Actinomycetota bacterium]|nr:16S rRNA (uracil(1498)-N(3))-methyltransferase [Actinomycetota bacterium]
MLSLFFVDELSGSKTQALDNDEAHHAIKVMRLRIGEEIKISDGEGSWVSGPISEVGKKSLKITVTSNGIERIKKPELVLVQAMTKSDRNKEMLELITVAGVDRIIPWQADRISKWQSNSYDKWSTSIKEASKQSRRVNLPKLEKVMSTKQIIEQMAVNVCIVVFHESADQKLSDLNISQSASTIYLIIGPEGGIAEGELEIFKTKGGNLVRLGEPVLRSAHAGFAALASIQTKLGRW